MTPRHYILIAIMLLVTLLALIVSAGRLSAKPTATHLEQAIGNNQYIILLYNPYNSPALQGYCRTDDNCIDVLSVDDVDFKK